MQSRQQQQPPPTTDTLSTSLSKLSLNTSVNSKFSDVLGFSSDLERKLQQSKRNLDNFIVKNKLEIEKIKIMNQENVSNGGAEIEGTLQRLAEVRKGIAAIQDEKARMATEQRGLERENTSVLQNIKNSMPERLTGEYRNLYNSVFWVSY